jgi:Domain of unknown function (DUF4037)
VRFPLTWNPSLSHKVELATVAGFAASRLRIDPAGGLSVLDWLILTGQSVLEVTAGPVFTDRTAELAQLRAMLRWYPPDIERYVLAAGWKRLSQEMPMVGRTAERGDEFGRAGPASRRAGRRSGKAGEGTRLIIMAHCWPCRIAAAHRMGRLLPPQIRCSI